MSRHGFQPKGLWDVVWSSETGRRSRIFGITSHAALTCANPGTHSDSSPTSVTTKVITDDASVPNLHPMIRTTRVSGFTDHDREITRPAIKKRRILPPLSEGPQAWVSSWSGAPPSHDLSPQPEHGIEMTNTEATLPTMTSSMTPAKIQLCTGRSTVTGKNRQTPKLKPRWDVHLSGDDDQLG